MLVTLNSPGFSYDVHSLVKAFYPGEDVLVVTPSGDTAEPSQEPSKGPSQEPENIRIIVSPPVINDGETVSGNIEITAIMLPEGTGSLNDSFTSLTRPEVKSQLKRLLYKLISEVSQRELPWGTMTGIRPVKVPMKMIREGATDDDIAGCMQAVYLCSEEKTKLATDIAHREAKILDGLDDGGFSLYIGIPFCPTTCLYCSFTSYPIVSWKNRTDEYLTALKKELDLFSDIYRGRRVSTIYIGGGTPTTLSAVQLEGLAGYVAKKFDLSQLAEYTVEAGRPDSIDPEKLCALRQSGVNRISINPQTMNEKTLKLIGRRHSTDDVYNAFKMARDAGFTNINTDLILGLPGEDESDVRYTFDRIRELSPDSLTVHSMALKRAAGMHDFLEEHKDIKSRNTPQMMVIAQTAAASMGMEPYYLYRQKNMAGNFENVGYAREGCYGIYNIIMMEETEDIAAVGAGTVSKRVFDSGRIERCDTVKDVAMYIDRIDEMIDRKRKLFTEQTR